MAQKRRYFALKISLRRFICLDIKIGSFWLYSKSRVKLWCGVVWYAPPARTRMGWVALFRNFFYFFIFFFTFAGKGSFAMVNLEKFRENARREGICDRYAVLWDGCGSKKGLMDLALSAQGADFVCDGIVKGWGISVDEIKRRFGKYINGGYVYEDESGYSSVMYCGYEGNIDVDSTLVVLIDSDVVLVVPDWHVCDVYASGKVSMSIVGGGRVRLIAYGDAGDVVVDSIDEGCRFRRIQKSHWSRGEQ